MSTTEPIPDCVLPGELARVDVEKAYRRGFHQGAALFLQALQEGATDAELRVWLERLLAWRRRTADWTGERPVKPVSPLAEPPYEFIRSAGVRAWRRALRTDIPRPEGS
jgi:hypothetical protein